MKQETLSWIVENYSIWQAICRVHGKKFTGDEVMQTFRLLLYLAETSSDFGTIFTVFITIYENELPFFAREEESEQEES